MAAEAHASYIGRVDGFELAGTARSAGEALRFLERDHEVDLLLLDFHMPDGHGLALLQRLRAAGHLCDVIAVTSARDVEVVRRAVAQGVVLGHRDRRAARCLPGDGAALPRAPGRRTPGRARLPRYGGSWRPEVEYRWR